MPLYERTKNIGSENFKPFWRQKFPEFLAPFQVVNQTVPAQEMDILHGVAPERMDEMLLEALEALAQVRRLYESTPNPETKRQTKCILENLHSSLLKLAPLGIHSVRRLENLPARR